MSLRIHKLLKKLMNKTFTTTDLMLFAFNETAFNDTVFINKALENNYCLNAEFEEIVATIDYVDTLSLGPSTASMNAIIQYSRAKMTS